jgi:hypothetical protein
MKLRLSRLWPREIYSGGERPRLTIASDHNNNSTSICGRFGDDQNEMFSVSLYHLGRIFSSEIVFYL